MAWPWWCIGDRRGCSLWRSPGRSQLRRFAAVSGRQIVLDLLVGLIGLEVCFVAATRSRRISALLAALGVGLLIICHAAWGSAHSPQELLAEGLVVAIAWLIGHTISLSHRHSEALRARATAEAVTAERLRIARDLHDMVAHSIGVIAIQAGAGGRVIDHHPGQAREALAAIETTSRDTLAGLRRMLTVLRRAEPGSAAFDAPPGLADLPRLAALTADVGVRVDVQRIGQLLHPLPADVDLSAFRIVQEAVANVVRHAGADHCQVTIGQSASELSLEVTDNGRGGVICGDGFGIVGMRERVALLAGEFSAGPRPGGGFRVAARLPLPAADSAPAPDLAERPARAS